MQNSSLPWIAPTKALSLDLENLTEAINDAIGVCTSTSFITLAYNMASSKVTHCMLWLKYNKNRVIFDSSLTNSLHFTVLQGFFSSGCWCVAYVGINMQEGSVGLPVTFGIAAATGLGLLAFSEVSLIESFIN